MDNVQRDLSRTSVELQRLLRELDSLSVDHKDREWMQRRVLALQQEKAALQQEKTALVQKELLELQQRGGGALVMDTDQTLYRGITLFTPRACDGYLQRNLKFTTRRQLAAKLSAKGYDAVAVVDCMPLQLLGPDCDAAQDIDDVELADGMQLAVVVVVDAERTENRSREWAMQYLIQAGHKGVRPYCYKQITLKQDGSTRQVEIDGMAVSDTLVVLVERKPVISMKYVDELVRKLGDYGHIVDNNAPNTAQLATIPTVLSPRKRKPVQAVLMADGWVDNEYERAACKQAMLQAGILPVLPRADSHAQGDSCNAWPPRPEDLALAAQYTPMQSARQARGVATNAMQLQHTGRRVRISAGTIHSRPQLGIRHLSQPRWVGSGRGACVFK